MIEGRVIVSVANSWDYDPTSKHQIMKILSERNRVVWINYHGTRRPSVGRADLQAACAVLRRVAQGVQRISDSMVQVTPLVVPGAGGALLGRLQRRLLVAQIRRAIRAVDPSGRTPVQLWTFAPDVPYLVGKFGEECSLYYCVDEYSLFQGFDAKRITLAENELIDRADLVVTTSEPLHQTKSMRRPDVLLVRHGVDFDHFATTWRETLPRPADLLSIRGPIFGFFGLIHHWVDVRLLASVARQRPHYTFVLLGDARVDVSELETLPNVRLLGRRPYETLPAYCAAFDVGLMPFARSPMTRNINPIKMYEYLAAGLPIVSTPLPEAERFAGPILFGDSAAGFAEACDQALATLRAGTRERISRVVEQESWRRKVETLSHAVLTRLGGATQPVAIRREVAKPSARAVASRAAVVK